MNKQRVLITGGSGFMGQYLIKILLKNGYQVLSLDKRKNEYIGEFESVVCNILEKDELCNIFKSYLPQIVVHLAARIDLDEKEDINGYADNIDGVSNLVEAINYSGSVKRVLVTSSQLVSQVGYVQKHEYDYCPNNLYGESKVLTETIIREANMPGVTWCILRPTTIWGEGMSSHYQRFLKMIIKGRYVHIGGSLLYKTYGYIGNSMYQYLKFIAASDSIINKQVFYIADYKPLSLIKWSDSLAAELGAKKIKKIPISIARIVGHVGDFINYMGYKSFPFNSFRLNNVITEYIFDMEKTSNIVGKLPYTVDDGVKNTARWFLDKSS